MGYTPKKTKELMRLAEKTMAGDKEAEADLMLETPTEFMEKMNVKEPKAIAKKLKETYGSDGKPKLDTMDTPKATKQLKSTGKPKATGKLKSKQSQGRAKPSMTSSKGAATRKKSMGGNPKAKASGMGY